MNKVKLIVDSTVDLTSEMYKEHDFFVMPLMVNFGEDNYKDGEEITPDEIYERVKKDGVLPSTAAISPAVFEEQLRKFIDEGYDIVYLGIGSKLSTTFQNFKLAMNEFPEGRIFPIDSENLSTGSGLLALKCAKLRDEGKSAKEIAEEVQLLSKLVSAKFCLDRLDYMHKGGRCSAMTALFGKLLHIHPVLKMVDGKLLVEKKPRGPIKAAYKEMIDELKEDLPNVDMDNIMITHAGMPEESLEFIKEEVAKLVDPSVIRITRAGCVISSHCGYGTVGILYIKK